MFKKREIICSECSQEIKGGEDLVAFIKVPRAINMPYGLFSVALAKKAKKIYCMSCYKK